MDNGSNCNEYYMNVLTDFAALKTSYVQATENLKQLETFVGLLREELKVSRDEERRADFRKNCVQIFVTQQQEIINKLLSIKEEKETLNHSFKELQNTNNELVIKYKAEQERRDSEIEQMRKTHNEEILLIRESADEEVQNIKTDSQATLNTLNMRCTELTSQIALIKSERENTSSTVQKFQENIKKLTEKVKALQTENTELKERSAANITIFQTKLAEQERQHLAELETWKLAELNRNPPPPPQNNSFKPSQFNPNIQLPSNYPPNSNSMNQQYVTNPMIYQHHSFYQQQSHKPPLSITTSKKTVTSFQSANDFYRQNKNPENNKSEKNMCEEEKMPEVLKEHVNINVNKPKFPASIKKRKLYNKDSDWAD